MKKRIFTREELRSTHSGANSLFFRASCCIEDAAWKVKKKNNLKMIYAILLISGLMGILIVSSYRYINDSSKKEELTKISVIVYGTGTSDRWSTMKQGLDQGAIDFNAEINFVTTTEEKNAKEQKALIEREIANGAKGIILAAADSNLLSVSVQDHRKELPIVLVETSIKKPEGVTYISADNYSMGLNIGRSVFLSSEENKTIAVFVDNIQRNSVSERYEGLMDSLKYTECTINLWELGEEDTDVAAFLEAKLKEDPADAIVTLDDKSLEDVIDAVQAVESDINIYGIGSTNKIVHFLDYGLIDSIVFQNEFNMGYLSVQEIINDIKHKAKKPDVDIEFRTVNRDTIYLPKNQRLVFPIIQ